jgi:hypothetical protein
MSLADRKGGKHKQMGFFAIGHVYLGECEHDTEGKQGKRLS